jgi:hypothetical protein
MSVKSRNGFEALSAKFNASPARFKDALASANNASNPLRDFTLIMLKAIN